MYISLLNAKAHFTVHAKESKIWIAILLSTASGSIHSPNLFKIYIFITSQKDLNFTSSRVNLLLSYCFVQFSSAEIEHFNETAFFFPLCFLNPNTLHVSRTKIFTKLPTVKSKPIFCFEVEDANYFVCSSSLRFGCTPGLLSSPRRKPGIMAPGPSL